MELHDSRGKAAPPLQRSQTFIGFVADGTSCGVCAAAVLAALVAGTLAISLRHIFKPAWTLGPWFALTWGWYVLGLAAIAGLLALGIAGLARLAPYRPLSRAQPSVDFYLVVVAFLALHIGILLNLLVLPYPVVLDRRHVAANGMLLLLTSVVALSLLRATRLPRVRGSRKLASATVLAAIAAIGLGRAWPLPAEFAKLADVSEPVEARPMLRDDRRDTSRVATPKGTAGSPRRNVLFVTVDALRADHLGAYGYGRDTSPLIDTLAAEGTTFDLAFAAKPITSPSFASIMTGTHIRRHGIHGTSQILAPEHLTLAEILRNAGFATAAVVENGNLFPIFGFDQGFDFYDYQPTVPGKPRDATELTDAALVWLKRGTKTPFFFWLHYIDPHNPYRPADRYQQRYVGDRFYGQIPLPPGECEPLKGASRGFGEFADDPETNLAWHIAQYDGEVRFVNDELERFLAALERHHRLDDTLLVFSADHGESFGEKDLLGHGTATHDSSTHVPLFFRLPGVIPERKRIHEPISNVDILPTLLDLAGVEIPPEVQGQSRADWILTDASHPDDDAAAVIEAGYGHHVLDGTQEALRTARWCYVWRDTRWALRPKSPVDLLWTWNALLEGALARDELYDLESDPGETKNLIAAGLPVADELRARLLVELARQGPESAGAKAIDHKALKREDPSLESQLRELGYIDD